MADNQRFRALDSWRGIAAIMVALFHLSLNNHVVGLGVMKNASLFVDFFFVLSGFVLTHAYASALEAGMPFRKYVLLRVGRLWPLHIFMILVLVALEFNAIRLISVGYYAPRPTFAVSDQRDIPMLIVNALLVQGLWFIHRVGWNEPAWSISTEFWACLVFGLMAATMTKRRLLLGAIAMVTLCFAALSLLPGTTYMGTDLRFAFLQTCGCFFLGHLIYRGRDIVRLPARWATTLEIASVATMLAILSLLDPDVGSPWLMVVPIAFAAVVFVFSFEQGRLSAVLLRKPFLLIGTVSYSIYLVHATIATIMGPQARACLVDARIPYCEPYVWLARFVPAPQFYFDEVTIAYLLIIMAVACVTYALVEEPGRRASKWIARRMTNPTHSDLSHAAPARERH